MKYSRTGLAAWILAAAAGTAGAAQMMGPPPVPMSANQFLSAPVGSNVQIAARVERIKRSTVWAVLLERETDTLDKNTRKRVELFVPRDTPVVMGTASQVVPGAVLFVYGVLTARGHVDVKRLVIDTQYVKVSDR